MNNIVCQTMVKLIFKLTYFWTFLLDLKIDEETCIFGLHYMIQKPTLFSKWKPNDICTNGFGIHVGPLWGANINAQYILDPYATTLYCTSYLTKIDKSVIQEMKIILNKYKQEQTEPFDALKS